MSHRVAFFGGSFNPPHIAHLFATVYVLSTADIDELLVVPVFIHPFDKPLAGFEHRLAMCQAAFGWVPGVTVSCVEQQLGGPSRTLRTLQHLQTTHPDWALRLIIGSDILHEAPRWSGFDRISAIAPPLVLPRPEAAGERGLFPDVSSTRVRQLLGSGKFEEVRALLPAPVLRYIQHHGLYGAAPSEDRDPAAD